MSYAQYCRLRVSCNEKDIVVIRAASKMLKKRYRFARDARVGRHRFYRNMLHQHAMAKDLYSKLMGSL